MVKNLMNLHDALCTISTKGQDTLMMADCISFLRTIISELEEKENSETVEECEHRGE